MKNRFVTILTMIVMFSSITLFVCLAKNNTDAGLTKIPPRPVPVVQIKVHNPGVVREFPGKVRANRRVELAFSVPGVLVELNASEGTRFKKGEIIARLDPRDFRYALDIATAAHTEAKATYERKLKLFQGNVIAQSDLDRFEAAYHIAQGEFDLRKKALSDSVLKAPFDGVIARRYVENHEHIQAKVPIVSLQDVSVVDVVVQLPEILVAHGGLENLKSVKVNFDADGDQLFEAGIIEYSSQADPATRTYEAVVELPSPENLNILPGMTASVHVNTSHDTGAPMEQTFLVPVEAVWGGENNQSYVWVIDEKNQRAVKREVVPGEIKNSEIEISAGLSAGEKVAVAGIHHLNEELPVRALEGKVSGLDL